MIEENVLPALRAKQVDLERRVASYGRKIEALSSDLANMRAVLMFHEQAIANDDFLPHMSVRRLFSRGEILGYCLEAMRKSEVSLDTRELATHVIARKGMDTEDGVLRKKIVFSVMQVMKTGRRRRMVKEDGKRLGVRLWRLHPDSKKNV